MLGFLLVFLGNVSSEVGTSIGKYEVQKKKEGLYTMGFLNLIWGNLFFFFGALFMNDGFRFTAASLPTVGIRAVLGILQLHFTLKAIVSADRSTFGFLRILTIPLLLTIDLILGYTIGLGQFAGIGLIIVSLVFLFANHGLKRSGVGFVLFTAINAALTISLYKFNITHYNSVAVEQIIAHTILLAYLLAMTTFVEKVNPFAYLKKRVFLAESIFMGLGSVLVSFAYLFAPASIITTVKRALLILTSTISGNAVFHEKKLFVKLIAFLLILGGLVLLVL